MSSIIAELVRVLAVLAFGFLAFAPQPAPIERYGVSPAVTAAIDSGAELPGDRHDPDVFVTKACDSCRLAVSAALPIPPTSAGPTLDARPVARPVPVAFAFRTAPPLIGGGPRAPPLTVLV